MNRQLNHLVRLVDDLLDISRVTLGKVTLRTDRIDFHNALESALEAVRPAVEARKHELVVDLPDEALWLDADSTRLAQVMANILSNAVQYTPPGGRIRISASADDGTLVVVISDTGAGIDPEVLPHIFDLFTQARHPTGSAHQGLGIGLTLVRAFVEMHGGSVAAQSDGPGRGSRFTIRLPLGNETAAERLSARAADAGASPQLRVLVVDDNSDAAESLSILLEMQGHEVGVAGSGEEALRRVGEFRPQAAFVDIGLPGIDGYEVAQRIRSDASLEGLRLVALTGWGAEEDRARAHAAGFDLHIVKPASLDEVQAAIADLAARPH
jgi:CheY-like chemotaxis protein